MVFKSETVEHCRASQRSCVMTMDVIVSKLL